MQALLDHEVRKQFERLQKKHPDIEYRVLHIEDPEENFAFTFRHEAVGVVLIESTIYWGIAYQKISRQYDPDITTIDLIVDVEEFEQSAVRGRLWIKKYGI